MSRHRKTGGLAAIMSGQPVVKTKRDPWRTVRKYIKSCSLHCGLLIFCVCYIYLGALVFRAVESPHELSLVAETERQYKANVKEFMNEVEVIKKKYAHGSRETKQIAKIYLDVKKLNETLYELVDEYSEKLFKLYDSSVSQNYFDSIFYNNGEYRNLWTMDSALLFTATTMVPVGFGLITPLTIPGRLFLCIYAMVGIPLALVTMTDIGKFCCNGTFIMLKENMTVFCCFLIFLLLAYPLTGGIIIHYVTEMALFDSIYYCCITILTVGYGDIGPPIPVIYLILFIVVGVTIVTISVDVIGAQAIHHVHYMGRQMGKAKLVATKMIQMAQKISINKGLGLGMAQLGAFARMGMMINVGPNGTTTTQITPMGMDETLDGLDNDGHPVRKSTAFDPELDFDLIDVIASRLGFENDSFGYFDDGENDAFY